MKLDDLREEIGETDRKILELMKKRLDIAEEIGNIKMNSNTPVKNVAVENEVAERYRCFAVEHDMDPDIAESVCRMLIRESVERQVALPRKDKHKRKIAIIGGAGKMGRWFSELLSSAGNEIFVIDTDIDNGLTIENSASADVVIVAVPISITDNILTQLDTICKEDAVIFDLASLKSPFMKTLKDLAKKRNVCSVHPMFGPSARSMYKRNLIICDCGNEYAVKEVLDLLGNKGGDIRVMDVELHDRYMSYVLGLSHAVNIAFFTTLLRSGIPYDDMRTVASTTFRKNMDTNESVALEDPMLYYSIQHLNNSRDEMWSAFTKAVDDIKKASADDDPECFVKLMNGGREYFRN